MIRLCTCKHKFQDERYGKFKRVHTISIMKKVCRCTVCGKEKQYIEKEKPLIKSDGK